MKGTLISKLRQRLGNAAFSENEVRLIKGKLKEGSMSPRELAEVYQVGVETIRRIGRGETWAWVDEEDSTRVSSEAASEIANPEVDRKGAEILKRVLAANSIPVPEALIAAVEPTHSAVDKMEEAIRKKREADQALNSFLEGGGEK